MHWSFADFISGINLHTGPQEHPHCLNVAHLSCDVERSVVDGVDCTAELFANGVGEQFLRGGRKEGREGEREEGKEGRREGEREIRMGGGLKESLEYIYPPTKNNATYNGRDYGLCTPYNIGTASHPLFTPLAPCV